MSSDAMTVEITVDDRTKIITEAPPIVRRFIGQPAINLSLWMNKQGHLRVELMDTDEDNPGPAGAGKEEY